MLPACRWRASPRARTCASWPAATGPSSCAATAHRRRRGGAIVDRAGTVLGRHEGHHRFTVGQRRGIGVAATEPLYVLAKDARANRVVVGTRAELAVRVGGVDAAGVAPARRAGHERAPALPRAGGSVRGRRRRRGSSSSARSPGAGAGPDGVPDGRRPGRRLGHDERRPPMSDRIVLEAPLDGDFGSVVRLIVGGIAAGADLGFEEMDDLQLAIERLYAESGGQERLTHRLRHVAGARAGAGRAAARARGGRRAPARAASTARSAWPACWTPSWTPTAWRRLPTAGCSSGW